MRPVSGCVFLGVLRWGKNVRFTVGADVCYVTGLPNIARVFSRAADTDGPTHALCSIHNVCIVGVTRRRKVTVLVYLMAALLQRRLLLSWSNKTVIKCFTGMLRASTMATVPPE